MKKPYALKSHYGPCDRSPEARAAEVTVHHGTCRPWCAFTIPETGWYNVGFRVPDEAALKHVQLGEETA